MINAVTASTRTDEEPNRDAWLGEAYEPQDMIKVLKALLGRCW